MNEFFDEVVELPLKTNYRSPQNIVKVANYIRDLAEDDIQQDAFHSVKPGSVKIYTVQTQVQEGSLITDQILENLKLGYSYQDMCIISRTNAYLKTIVEPALIRANIPYKFANKRNNKKLTQKPINIVYFDFLSYLIEPNLYATLSTVPYLKDIGEAFADKLEKSQIDRSIKLDQTKLMFVQEYQKALDSLREDFEEKPILAHMLAKFRRVLYEFIKPIHTEKQIQIIEKTIGYWYDFYYQKNFNWVEIFQTILFEIDEFDQDESHNSIELATIHSQKGLEHPISIVGGFTYPKARTDEFNDAHKMLYVQLTRAKERLIIVNSVNYVTYDQRIIRDPYREPIFDKLMFRIKNEKKT